MPQLTAEQAARVVERRHAEWSEWHGRWRWLLDSYDGGQRYRDAVYGYDHRGMPLRNLVRHKREYPDPNEGGVLATSATYAAGIASGGAATSLSGGTPDASQFASDSDYELRRARTPVPTFVREAVETHLATIFAKEVVREGPAPLEAWWKDVDGMGTAADDWMEYVVGPVFMTLGQIDLCVDHPPAPDGEDVASRADLDRLGLDRAVASFILPDNMVWWRALPSGRYAECLVREHAADPETGDLVERFRHWDADGSTLVSADGDVLRYTPHRYGRVPIERLFYRRRTRTGNVGMTIYEGIAERQREYYNRDSELILSDTTQAHPLLQGPEDFVKEDGSIPVGPGWLLPKKKNTQGGSATYEGFEVVDFPKGAAESLRQNKRDIRDEVDRDACLTKPAGAQGTGGDTVSQSGVSKQLDSVGGHKMAAQIAKALARVEAAAAGLAAEVLGLDPSVVRVVYPSSFSLSGPDELAKGLGDFQALVEASGSCPMLETEWLQELARANLPGRSEADYKAIDDEIADVIEAKSAARGRQAEGAPTRIADEVDPDPDPPGGETEAQAEPEAPPDYNPYPGGRGLS